MTPWQNERWATAPTNDGRNFAPAHRWAVVTARPLCFGWGWTIAPAVGLPCGHCNHWMSKWCYVGYKSLRKWANGEARSAVLARSYIREAHELRKSVDELRNTLFASMSPCVLCGIEEQKIRLVQWQNGLYSVMCVSCGGGCSCHPTQADAIRAWNTRGFEDANDRIDAYELVINEDRQRIATLEAENAALRGKQPRCPDCGHRLDTEECGCLRADAGAIQTDDDCEAALVRIENLWGAKTGTPDGDALDALLDSVVAYEAAHHLVPEPDKGGDA